MPEPLDRYYRKRKTNEPIERDGDQVESYQSSRRQWQYYLVRKVRFTFNHHMPKVTDVTTFFMLDLPELCCELLITERKINLN